MARGTRSLKGSARHRAQTHARWASSLDQTDYVAAADGGEQQCGGCRWWIPLTGVWGLDWGACSNPASTFDARVRFEHDGCQHFDRAEGGWVVPDEDRAG